MLVDGSIGAFNHQDGIAYLDAVRTPPRNADDDVAAAVAGRHGFSWTQTRSLPVRRRPQPNGLARLLAQSSQSTDLRTYQPRSSRVEMYSAVQGSPVAPTTLVDCAA